MDHPCSRTVRPDSNGATDGPDTPAGLVTVAGRQFRNGRWRAVDDTVTEECVLTIRWGEEGGGASGEVSLRAWPHDLAVLAAGHILLEKAGGGPRSVAVAAEGMRLFSVRLGAAGKAEHTAPGRKTSVDPFVLLRAMRAFIGMPGRWESTGCFHRAGIFTPSDEVMLHVAEDIGRHNCLDRLAGWAAMHAVPLDGAVLLVTARLTGSLCAKALRAGFRVLAGRSAVTTDALALAREAGAALAGFVRPEEDRFTVFVDEQGRITDFSPEKSAP